MLTEEMTREIDADLSSCNHTEDFIDEYKQMVLLAQNCGVIISFTNENGKRLYSIAPIEQPDYWLNAFRKIKDAKAFCDRFNLPYEVK